LGGRQANKHQQPISGFTDRIHERPMLIKVSYDLGHPLKVSACCFIQAFHDRVLMLPALDDKERIALSPDFRLLLPCLLVSNCPKSSQEAISSNFSRGLLYRGGSRISAARPRACQRKEELHDHPLLPLQICWRYLTYLAMPEDDKPLETMQGLD